MVDERCAGDPTPPPDTPTDNCALDETNKAREFMYVLCFSVKSFVQLTSRKNCLFFYL